MTTVELIVTLAGLGAIGWINWYFFLSGRAPTTASAGAPQRFVIQVDHGYVPAAIRVRAGEPVRLDFHRIDHSSCTEEVVLADFGIRAFLPSGRTTTVEFTPTKAGSYEFACGMGMVRGKIIAEPPDREAVR